MKPLASHVPDAEVSGNGPLKAENSGTLLITHQRCGYLREWETI